MPSERTTIYPKQMVARGYDRIGGNYLDLVRSMDPGVRLKYLQVLVDGLAAGSRLLELGCGAGQPMTLLLAHHFQVTGLDISPGQLALARRIVPEASLVQGDMTDLCFARGAFDGAAAFYAITHVPRREHGQVLAGHYRVLRPGGLLVLTTGTRASGDAVEEDWLGAPMFFSHYDGDTSTRLVEAAGFAVESTQDEQEVEYSEPVSFHWIVARKPAL